MAEPANVVYYMNQFFAGIGGEDKADQPPTEFEGPKGPAQLFQEQLGDRGTVVKTVVCGDNYFSENEQEAVEDLLDRVREASPDLFVAGPAFGSGRHGIACATISNAVSEQLDVPAVTAMHHENPGVDRLTLAYALPTEVTATGMEDAVGRMTEFGRKLIDGEPIGDSESEGYIPRNKRANFLESQSASQRALSQLGFKLSGEPYTTEVPLPDYDVIPASEPVLDMSDATVALVTEAGVVPTDNPDGLKSWYAEDWYVYSLEGSDNLSSDAYKTVHAGWENTQVNEDPDRAVPVDAMRVLEREGKIGKLADFFISTTGMEMETDKAKKMGFEIGEFLRREGVDAVVLTST